MALLEVKQLTKHFGGLTAVGDVTLELNQSLIHISEPTRL